MPRSMTSSMTNAASPAAYIASLAAGGKYEMATLQFNEGDTIKAKQAVALVTAAIALNVSLGDPTDLT